PDATDVERAAFRHVLGLDRSIAEQYVHYVGTLLRGDFGRSFWQGEPALRVVLARFPATLQLSLAAIGIVLAVGIPVGVLAAVRRATIVDHVTMAAVAL